MENRSWTAFLRVFALAHFHFGAWWVGGVLGDEKSDSSPHDGWVCPTSREP
jgi:hypothetical protein